MNIRVATLNDTPALLAIYAQYLATAITFEYTLPSEAEFAGRIADTLKTYPYLVLSENGRICGYAYAHRLQSREAYQWGAELSIYLDRATTGRGAGPELYAVLIELLRQQGVRTVYGCVATPNPASEKLHERMGFRRLGCFRNAGFKNGAWHDITWFEKVIAEYGVPSPLLPFPELPEAVRRQWLIRFPE